MKVIIKTSTLVWGWQIKGLLFATILFSCHILRAEVVRSLSLKDVIDMTFESSFERRQSSIDWEIAQIRFDNTKTRLSLPRFGIVTNYTSASTIYQVPGSEVMNNPEPKTNAYGGGANGYIGFGISEFTIFNSWLDTIDLKIAELTKEIGRVSLQKVKSAVRFRCINAYFSYYQLQRNRDVADRDIELARAIVDLLKARNKASTNQSSKDNDIQLAELEISNSERRLVQAKKELLNAKVEFQKAIGLHIKDSIELTTSPKFFPFRQSLDELKSFFEQNNSELLGAKLTYEANLMNIDRIKRAAFPVKVSMSALSWLNRTGYYSERSEINSGTSPNGNWNATLNLNIDFPIFGEFGFFNQGQRAEGALQLKKSEENLRSASINGAILIETLYQQIQIANEDIKYTETALARATELLSQNIRNISKVRMTRLEIKDMLAETRNAEIEYNQKVFTYIQQILQLSELVGRDFTEELIN